MSDATVLASKARRRPMNEASLLWAISGSAICLVTYYYSLTSDAVPNLFGMNIPGNAITIGVLAGALIAAVYYLVVRGSILDARRAHAENLHQAQASREADTRRKIAAMKAAEGTS